MRGGRGQSFARLLAAVLLAAVVVVVVGCGSSGASPSASASAAPVQASIARTPSPPPFAHLAVNRIGFDYPATWTVRTPGPGVAPPFGGIVFVGTAPSTAGCRSTGSNT